MSKKTMQAPQSAVFGPFSGLDMRTPHAGKPATCDIVNFRLSKAGSLIKREGCHHFQHFPSPIRATWIGKFFDTYCLILLCGSSVKRLDLTTNTITTIGNIATTESNMQFFFYRDRLFLIGGEALYQIEKDSVSRAMPYVPLIGKDWATTRVGEIFEPRNLLTRHARIQYLIEKNSSVFLRTLYDVESIEALYVNDELRPSMEYSYDSPSRSIIMAGLSEGDRVHVRLIYKEQSFPEMTVGPITCTRVEVFGDAPNNRLFFWDGVQANLFYPTTYVSELSLVQCKEEYPDCTPLYIPEHTFGSLGDGQYAITGFVRQYDRLLIFTESDAWMLRPDATEGTSFSAMPINPVIGCVSSRACTMAQNSPITIALQNIYRWTADTDEYSECNAYSICEPIRELLSEDFFQKACVFHHRSRNEVWFYEPASENPIWVYSLDEGSWVRFLGIQATDLIEVGNRILICNGCELSVLDPSYREDIDADGVKHEIVAEFQSHPLEYETHRQKRFSALCLHGDCDGGTINVTLMGNGLRAHEYVFGEANEHTTARRRLTSGRFSYATIRLSAGGEARQIIQSLVSEVR